jgi:hypothetical protein
MDNTLHEDYLRFKDNPDDIFSSINYDNKEKWDSNPQAVRQSLDEIKDVYLEKIITPEQKKLLKKIVLCTNGIIKQEVEINWKSYIGKHTIKNEIEYELWDGYKLASDIEENMLNEYIPLGN